MSLSSFSLTSQMTTYTLTNILPSRTTTCLVLSLILLNSAIVRAQESTIPNSAQSSSSSSSSRSTSSGPTTVISTTTDPTVCVSDIAANCTQYLKKYFGRNATGEDVATSEEYEKVAAGLHCSPDIADAAFKTCLHAIPLTDCTPLRSISQTHILRSDNITFTKFSLMCTSKGIVPIAWNPSACLSEIERAIEKTTEAICSLAGNITAHSNSSSKLALYCRDNNETASPTDLYMDPHSLVQPWYNEHKCYIVTTTTSEIPLSPNPVSPAAITAIVVLVCLAIVSVLAAFFFWPKCHINDPALLPKKKKKNQDEGMINDGFDFGGASGGGAQYNTRKDGVALKIPPTFGPSAA